MKTVFVAAFVFCSFSLAVFAKAQDGELPHSLRDDVWALQFGLSGDNLSAFSGGVISAKHHYADGRALRYGLNMHGDYRNSDDGGQRHDVHILLTTQYVIYPTLNDDPAGTIQLFYGAGPDVGIHSNRRSMNDQSASDWSLSIGASAAIGAEWFVKRRISISGEYRPRLTFSYGSRSTHLHLRSGTQFGTSIYF